MHAVDFFPTLLSAVAEAAGEAPPSLSTELDGVSQWSTITNTSNLNITSIAHAWSPRVEIPHNVDPMLKAANGE
jgi:arylsulfatase A-like enzyme